MTEKHLRPATLAFNDEVGPWEPVESPGYGGRQRSWVLRRNNPKWWGGQETMQTGSIKDRRFGSKETAQAAADIANSGTR